MREIFIDVKNRRASFPKFDKIDKIHDYWLTHGQSILFGLDGFLKVLRLKG